MYSVALAEITSLALVDAVNPCTLAVQVILLSALVMTKGRKHAVFGGFLFTATIYAMYVLFGVGVLQVLYALGLDAQLRWILKGLLVIMAVVEISAFFSYRPGFASMEMPMWLRPMAKKTISSVENPLMAVPVAALCSFILLPCSSGPYAAALLIINNLEFVAKAAMLVYYNFLFTLPMFGLTFMVALGTAPGKIMGFKDRYVKELHLIAGILLLLVLLMV